MHSWLPNTLDARAMAAVLAALNDVGEMETPAGSNRGPYVDALAVAAGSPLGSYWCATAVTSWWRAAHLAVPPKDAGACEAWRKWAFETGRFSAHPDYGAVALYGDSPTHASHCGLVVRLGPVCDVEANTSLAGYSRNGEVVTLKAVDTTRLIGYVHIDPT